MARRHCPGVRRLAACSPQLCISAAATGHRVLLQSAVRAMGCDCPRHVSPRQCHILCSSRRGDLPCKSRWFRLLLLRARLAPAKAPPRSHCTIARSYPLAIADDLHVASSEVDHLVKCTMSLRGVEGKRPPQRTHPGGLSDQTQPAAKRIRATFHDRRGQAPIPLSARGMCERSAFWDRIPT